MRATYLLLLASLFTLITSQTTPSAITGECTKKACAFCMTDGKAQWCTSCAAGMVLTSEKPGEGACSGSLSIKNCMMADPSDRLNADRCSRCMPGYILSKDENKCLLVAKNGNLSCDNPQIWDGGKVCFGCDGHFLDEGYQACSKKTDIPKNCKYGDTESSKLCLECNNGYLPSKNREACEPFPMQGCKLRHSGNPLKCRECNYDNYYYATGAEKDGESVYQICTFKSNLINGVAIALVFFIYGYL